MVTGIGDFSNAAQRKKAGSHFIFNIVGVGLSYVSFLTMKLIVHLAIGPSC